METIEVTWVRPSLRTAVHCSIEIDDPDQASQIFARTLALLCPPAVGRPEDEATSLAARSRRELDATSNPRDGDHRGGTP